jgi:hypothetical protein
MRKKMIAALTALFVGVSTALPAAEPARVGADELLKVALKNSDLTAGDFEKYRLPDGRNSIRSQKPASGLMISFIGPADDVTEVVALARMEKETFLRHELLLTALAMTAARWDDGLQVVPDIINELAQKNGGKRQVTINGRIVAVGVMPPNLVSINVVKR